jgi:DNA-binding transcriptional regulator YiaG
MFKQKANATCNNILFNLETLRSMKQMHFSMVRLYKAAQRKGVIGQSAVAHAMNFSPQRVKNWESRGISEEGARIAQATFGCSSNWLINESANENDGQSVAIEPTTLAKEPYVDLFPPRQLDRQTTELVDLFNQLDARGKTEHLNYLKGYVAGRQPLQDGQALSVAG